MYFNLTYTNIENCDVLLNNYIVFVRKLSSTSVQILINVATNNNIEEMELIPTSN